VNTNAHVIATETGQNCVNWKKNQKNEWNY